MKILTVIHNYPPHRYIGAELYDHALHKALIKAGHTVNVKTDNTNTETYEYEGVQVNYPHTQEPYDLILTHVDCYQDAAHQRRLLNDPNIPIVAIQHNNSEWTVKDEAFYKFAGLIYNSEWMRTQSKNTTENKIVLTPPAKRPSKAKKTGNSVLLIGTTHEKGVGMFNSLAQNMPDQKFIGVSGGWGKNHRLPYPNITFMEQTNNLREVYLKAGTLLVPSSFESWSMSAGEAIGYGCHVITFDDLPGVRENLGDAATYLPRNASRKAWQEAINNPVPDAKIRKQALKNWKQHQKQLEETVTWLTTLAA